MSLRQQMINPVPEETMRVAKAAFPRGNIYMKMRDDLGTIYTDEDFAELYPAVGQPAAAPWRLALVTVMQFAEDLTDRQAAESVSSRIDWKYALGLELTDAGFHYSILSEFRGRLIKGEAEQKLLTRMLEVFKEQGWLKEGQRQRTDATHVIGHLRELTRIEMVGETLRHSLNTLAAVLPDWLQTRVPQAWYERYGKAFDEYRMPKDEAELLSLAEQIGRDGAQVLRWIDEETGLDWLPKLPAIVALRQVWEQQYEQQPEAIHWRKKEALPASADLIVTPYDTEARFSRKRELTWTGYKTHMTETCDPDLPHLITHVETTVSTLPDGNVLDSIHTDLAQQNLLPSQHVVDQAYTASAQLVDSQERGVDLLGPVGLDYSWQAQLPDGMDVSRFQIDWEAETVQCPGGHTNSQWQEHHDRYGNPVIQARFSVDDCLPCSIRQQCTRSQQGYRSLTLHPQAQHIALQLARQRQTTDEFKTAYRTRAGIEGTLSQAVQVSDVRHARYRGLSKTHLQNIATAAALDLKRCIDWLLEKPFAKTRVSRFAALSP